MRLNDCLHVLLCAVCLKINLKIKLYSILLFKFVLTKFRSNHFTGTANRVLFSQHASSLQRIYAVLMLDLFERNVTDLSIVTIVCT